MNLQERAALMAGLGNRLENGGPDWTEARQEASQRNNWFLPRFIDLAAEAIRSRFLEEDRLVNWAERCQSRGYRSPKNVGIIMPGNIPMAGFHDLLCTFMAGHRQTVKLSSADTTLMTRIILTLHEMDPATKDLVMIAENLKGCDAYIATGSNLSARYFDYYFAKYPHIIRHSKTSVAWISGNESAEELEKLADDINLYFGLGCRNVTKLLTPPDYDFSRLFEAMHKYEFFKDHHKYAGNYDYRLAVLLLNKQKYLTNGTLLITENPELFSPIGMLHYETWKEPEADKIALTGHPDIQCLVSRDAIPFGNAQFPGLTDYADGADTMQFLSQL